MRAPAACLVALLLIIALAQQPAGAAESAPGAWISGGASGSFGEPGASPLRWTLGGEIRYFDLGSGVYDYVAAGQLGYVASDSLTLWLGYGRFVVEGPGGIRLDENRPWQQINWRGPSLLGGRVSLRARAEQRVVNFADDLRHVLRVMGEYQRPVRGPLISEWFVSGEAFLDLNDSDWGGGTGLSQTRLFAGVGIPLREGLRMEVGVMQQYFVAERGEDRVNYLGMLELRWSF